MKKGGHFNFIVLFGMGKKRKHQGDPDNMFLEKKKKAKGQPQSRRKRRKLAHNEETKKTTQNGENSALPFTAHKDEVDVDASSVTFLQKLDPEELSFIPAYDKQQAI